MGCRSVEYRRVDYTGVANGQMRVGGRFGHYVGFDNVAADVHVDVGGAGGVGAGCVDAADLSDGFESVEVVGVAKLESAGGDDVGGGGGRKTAAIELRVCFILAGTAAQPPERVASPTGFVLFRSSGLDVTARPAVTARLAVTARPAVKARSSVTAWPAVSAMPAVAAGAGCGAKVD
jgi:hypothetical protein